MAILSLERIEKYKELNQENAFVIELLEIIEKLQQEQRITDKTYTHIADIFTRKMLLDLNHESIDDVDEFRRISRGIGAIAHYLDFKGVPE
jgi:hypothetical protein